MEKENSQCFAQIVLIIPMLKTKRRALGPSTQNMVNILIHNTVKM